MKIVIIKDSLSQPREIRRVIALSKTGFQLKVYSYDRGEYNCNKLPKDIEEIILGNLENGKNYISKLFTLAKDVKKIVKYEGEKDVLYYSFSYINTFFLNMLNVNYVYEIPDILYGYNKFKYIRPIMKAIDKMLVKKSVATIMTSQGFYEYLFNAKQKNIIIQSNKLNSIFWEKDRLYRKFEDVKSIKFGFVGAIRYPNTILRFAKVIGKKFPQHYFYFYGESANYSEQFKNETKQYTNVIFKGRFKNPEDLSSIYNNIDIVVCCYENKSLNECIAEPNKLYEAMFFCKPIIVSSQTFLEKQVRKYKCGYAIDAYSDEEIVKFINSLNVNDLNEIASNDLRLSELELIDNENIIIDKVKSLNMTNFIL